MIRTTGSTIGYSFVPRSHDFSDMAPMLIHADWLEECGDLVAAEVLRGLADGGIVSLVALALSVVLVSMPHMTDRFRSEDHDEGGPEDEEALGSGAGDALGDGDGTGFGAGIADWTEEGTGEGEGDWHGDGTGDGLGDGAADEAEGGNDIER